MRGRPLLQWFVFVAVWLLLLIPIFLVTRPVTGAAKSNAAAPLATEPSWVSLRFSSDPVSFAIHQDDQIIWSEEKASGRFFEKAIPLNLDPDGVEFVVSARVPEIETAIEVTFESSGRPLRHFTIWGEGEIDETISFSWTADE
jgi:hypothetical protein